MRNVFRCPFPTYPDESKLKDGRESPVDGVTDVFDGDAVAEDDPVFEIRCLSGLLGVDSNLRADHQNDSVVVISG